jgi:hypothetical protein
MRSWVTTSMFFLYVTTLRFGRGCGWLKDRLLAPNLKRSWLPTIDPFEASPAVAAWRLAIPSWTTPTITDIITSSSSLSHLLHRSHQPSNRIGWLTWLSSTLVVAYCTATISGEEHPLLLQYCFLYGHIEDAPISFLQWMVTIILCNYESDLVRSAV